MQRVMRVLRLRCLQMSVFLIVVAQDANCLVSSESGKVLQ